jgi:hypothetical protein
MRLYARTHTIVSARLVRVLAAAAIVLSPALLAATSLNPLTDTELVKRAELIFLGVVTRVDYRMSTVGTTTDAHVPHTFVTFRVDRILKGRFTGTSTQFTMRLTGGSNPAAKRFMRLEGCPDFDIGERVVLFVRRNERALCPMAGWAQGRFRIVNDLVFSDSGREVWLTPQNALALGPRRDVPEVRTHHRGGGVYAHLMMSTATAEASPSLPPITGTRLNLAALITYLSWRITSSHTLTELSLLPRVTSSAADDPFFVSQFLAAVGGS